MSEQQTLTLTDRKTNLESQLKSVSEQRNTLLQQLDQARTHIDQLSGALAMVNALLEAEAVDTKESPASQPPVALAQSN